MGKLSSSEKREKSPKSVRILFSICAFIGLALGSFGAVILTEAGQMINLPSDWVFTFFYYRIPVSWIIAAILALLIILQLKYGFVRKWVVGAYSLTIIACLFFINSFAPEVWLRSQQYTAEYISIKEADSLLDENTDTFVLEINGEARAYPKEWMHLPHFAGDDFGSDHATVAYCVLSNLPLAFSSNIDGEEANYRVIAQAHNNLIFTDRNSGDLIQQITGIAEYSKTELQQYPIQRMPWNSFKELYPSGKVFKDTQYNALDKMTTKLFDRELEKHYEGKPIFPTLRLDDNRLSNDEQVYGLRSGNETLAITRGYLESNPLTNTELGGKKIVIAWFKSFETIGVFLRETEAGLIEVTKIDPYGMTDQGKLERFHLYPGVFWMVWSHWFPDTKILK